MTTTLAVSEGSMAEQLVLLSSHVYHYPASSVPTFLLLIPCNSPHLLSRARCQCYEMQIEALHPQTLLCSHQHSSPLSLVFSCCCWTPIGCFYCFTTNLYIYAFNNFKTPTFYTTGFFSRPQHLLVSNRAQNFTEIPRFYSWIHLDHFNGMLKYLQCFLSTTASSNPSWFFWFLPIS